MRYLCLVYRIAPLVPIIATLLIVCVNPVSAQATFTTIRNGCEESRQPGSNFQNRTLFRDIRDDFVYLIGQKDFYQIVGGVGLVPLAFKSQIKNESPEFTELWGESKSADGFFELGDGMGNVMYPLAAAALLYSIRGHDNNSSMKSFASDMIRAHLFNGLITLSMKGLINRKRPDGAPYGYPSGHTSTAFTSAGVLYHHFGAKVGIPSMLAASYVGFSRLQENKHYMSDVIAGAIIGTYISHKIANRKNDEPSLSFQPAMINSQPGIGVSLRFK